MKRIHAFDAAKGVFLILMTISHVGLINNQTVAKFNFEWLFIFKMPGFYIVAGYLMFNAIKRNGFMWRKIDGIYKPYFSVICIIYLLIWLSGQSAEIQDIYNVLLGFNGLNIGPATVYPAWFILSLLPAFGVCKILISKCHIIFKILIISLLLLLNQKSNWASSVPFFMQTSIYAVIYLMSGYIIRMIDFNLFAIKTILVAGGIYLVLNFVAGPERIHLNVAALEVGNPLLTWIVSVAAVLFVIGSMSLLRETSLTVKILSLLSRNSLFVLILHIPVYRCLTLYSGEPGGSNVLALGALNVATIACCLLIGLAAKKLDPKGRFLQARRHDLSPQMTKAILSH